MAKRNARGIERRGLILRAAVTVVARGGAGALTHRAAATEAGISLASVTYHFPSSDDLRRATFAFAADEIGPAFAASFECDGDHAAIIEDLARRWRDLGMTHRESFITLFSLLVEALHDPDLRSDVDGLLAFPIKTLTDEGISSSTADALVGSLVGLVLIALARNRPEEALDQFDQSVMALLAAFGRNCD